MSAIHQTSDMSKLIRPSHFWSSTYVPPSHYWNHSQSHSLVEIETLSISEDPNALRLPGQQLQRAKTLERASKSSSLKRLCGKGVSRMGSYLDTLHRSAKIPQIPEDVEEAETSGTAKKPDQDSVGPLQGPQTRDLRTWQVQRGHGRQSAGRGGGDSAGGSSGEVSSDLSDASSDGVTRSPLPSASIYIDLPSTKKKLLAWNCATGSGEEKKGKEVDNRAVCLRGRAACVCRPPADVSSNFRVPDLDPWDHRAIEYVMVPKAQYLSLYRANRFLREPCCCLGLGPARKLCQDCLQPTVLLRSPAQSPTPTSSSPTAPPAGGRPEPAADGSTNTARNVARASTLLPRLARKRPPGSRAVVRQPSFSSRALVQTPSEGSYRSERVCERSTLTSTDRTYRCKPDRTTNKSGSTAEDSYRSLQRSHLTNGRRADDGGQLPLRRGQMKRDYTDSWRTLSRTNPPSP